MAERTAEDVKLRPMPGDVLRKVKPRCVNVGNWKARALEAERERDEMDKIRQQHIAVEAQWLLVRLERDRFERERDEARAASQRLAVEIEELRRDRERLDWLTTARKAHIGGSILSRDLVFCECGWGLSRQGLFKFCPTCGHKIDRESYLLACEQAIKNGCGFVADHERLDTALAENVKLREAIDRTLRENGHLADGDNCTLIHLKRAISGSPAAEAEPKAFS